MKPFMIFTARESGKDNTTRFPDRREIHDAAAFREAVRYDYNPCCFRDFHRKKANFQLCNCFIMDVDNVDMKITPEDLRKSLPGVDFWVHYSRNNMKEKVSHNGTVYPPAPRYHAVFPLSRTYDSHDEVDRLKRRVFDLVEGFDRNALPVTQFLRGTENPVVEHFEGDLCIDEYLASIPETVTGAKDGAEIPAPSPLPLKQTALPQIPFSSGGLSANEEQTISPLALM